MGREIKGARERGRTGAYQGSGGIASSDNL